MPRPHGCARIQPVAGAYHEGSAGSERAEDRHAGDNRAGIFLQLDAGQHSTGGKLFSPERGGGVFAASYTLRGRLEDPDVSINPLAALTPGFLRGLFGLF